MNHHDGGVARLLYVASCVCLQRISETTSDRSQLSGFVRLDDRRSVEPMAKRSIEPQLRQETLHRAACCAGTSAEAIPIPPLARIGALAGEMGRHL